MADGLFKTLVTEDNSDAIKTAVEIIDNAIDGSQMQVDVVAALPAGSNAIGTLAANSGVDIGDVTINNASGASAVNIQDGGNTITIDGTVAISGTVTVDSTNLDIRDLSETTDHVLIFANTVKDGSGTDYVPLVDANGRLQVDVITGGGGGTEYSEDVATPATIVAYTHMFERDDALSTLTPVEGDWAAQRCNARGALWVELDLTNDVTIADGGNTITVDGTVAATQSGTWNITTLTGITNDVNIADGGNSITVDNSTLSVVGGGTEATALRVTLANDSTGLVSVDDGGSTISVDSATHDTLLANATIQIADVDVSAANPVPVTIVDPGVSSTEVHDYDTAASVAGSGTSNHDVTATGGTLIVRQVSFASSGAGKVEVIVDATGTPASKWAGFIPKASGEISHVFNPPLEIPITEVLRLTRTNREGSAQDLYSTVEGNQL
ncbi:MAG: hypothetical protein KAS32_26590 [Candidatus Peribacteraceae bacterium]|nr:hypothetical protein [Candidatus Peribacteraceae bacterium]